MMQQPVEDLGSVKVRDTPRRGPETWDEHRPQAPVPRTKDANDIHDAVLETALAKARSAMDLLTNPANTGSLEFMQVIEPNTRYTQMTRLLSEYIEHIEFVIKARGQ